MSPCQGAGGGGMRNGLVGVGFYLGEMRKSFGTWWN